jgi:hypothetical protein
VHLQGAYRYLLSVAFFGCAQCSADIHHEKKWLSGLPAVLLAFADKKALVPIPFSLSKKGITAALTPGNDAFAAGQIGSIDLQYLAWSELFNSFHGAQSGHGAIQPPGIENYRALQGDIRINELLRHLPATFANGVDGLTDKGLKGFSVKFAAHFIEKIRQPVHRLLCFRIKSRGYGDVGLNVIERLLKGAEASIELFQHPGYFSAGIHFSPLC